MNLKFISKLEDFIEQLEKGEIVIAQESFDVKTDRMYWFLQDGELKMVTAVASGVFKATDNYHAVYEQLKESILYVVEGAKITFKE